MRLMTPSDIAYIRRKSAQDERDKIVKYLKMLAAVEGDHASYHLTSFLNTLAAKIEAGDHTRTQQ